MLKSGVKKITLIGILLATFLFLTANYIIDTMVEPLSITLNNGEKYVFDIESPIKLKIDTDNFENVFSFSNNESVNENDKLGNGTLLTAYRNGNVKVTVSLLGIIPLRDINIDVVPVRSVMVLGSTAGIKLDIDGILVIGLSKVKKNKLEDEFPAREGKIETGDLILEINNTKIKSIEEMVKIVKESKGNELKFKCKRDQTFYITKIIPIKSDIDEQYHIGIWVREFVAGIGTMTFYNEKTKKFGALGHGIAEYESQRVIPIKKGQVIDSSILSITKGVPGTPGELKGVFFDEGRTIGNIKTNCEYGIYGTLNHGIEKKLNAKSYLVGHKNQVRIGEASILSNISDKKIESFKINIEKIVKKTFSKETRLIVKITDRKLLDKTGGIVQGMSGSPIIQDNKIIGAITHVLVNDPTRGYGIFVENMIDCADK